MFSFSAIYSFDLPEWSSSLIFFRVESGIYRPEGIPFVHFKIDQYEIPVSNILINQVPPSPEVECNFCRRRYEMYLQNIGQIRSIYDDFNLIEIPLAPTEIRGIESLRQFNKSIMGT